MGFFLFSIFVNTLPPLCFPHPFVHIPMPPNRSRTQSRKLQGGGSFTQFFVINKFHNVKLLTPLSCYSQLSSILYFHIISVKRSISIFSLHFSAEIERFYGNEGSGERGCDDRYETHVQRSPPKAGVAAGASLKPVSLIKTCMPHYLLAKTVIAR